MDHGSYEEIYAFVVGFRLTVRKPEDLCQLLPVIYYKTDEGTPPNAPKYRSEYLVQDVLSGKSDWSSDEVEEFREWLATNTAVNSWLSENFQLINDAIKNSHLWRSKIMADDS